MSRLTRRFSAAIICIVILSMKCPDWIEENDSCLHPDESRQDDVSVWDLLSGHLAKSGEIFGTFIGYLTISGCLFCAG